MPKDAVDALFAELNASLDNALVPPTMTKPPEHTLLNWNVVTSGARQNAEDTDLKRKAMNTSAEHKQLGELRARMEREKRKREKLKRLEIAQYNKAWGDLMKKEVRHSE